jgi:hypothetical protein
MGDWGYSYTILTSEKYGDEFSGAWISRFTPPPRPWMEPRISLDGETVWTLEKRKLSCPCQKSKPGRPACSYTDWAIPVSYNNLLKVSNVQKHPLHMFLGHVVQIKWQQMSQAVRYANFCESRNVRHLALVGLIKKSNGKGKFVPVLN